MELDAVAVLYRHLREMNLGPRESAKLDLMLHTNGGSSVVSWRAMSLLREFAAEVDLLVPNRAYSAGTLAALGADHVLMTALGTLGPTDATIWSPYSSPNPANPTNETLPIEVENLSAYVDVLSKTFGMNEDQIANIGFPHLLDKVHPWALSALGRSLRQSELVGKNLLGLRAKRLSGSAAAVDLDDEVATHLTSQSYDHAHPISRAEAQGRLGLRHVVAPPADIEDAMWRLYESYSDEMRLDEDFYFLAEAVAANGGSLPPAPSSDAGENALTAADVVVTAKTLFMESSARSDYRELQAQVLITRDAMGAVGYDPTPIFDGWQRAR